jgi:phosphoserine phosphatase RsbX
MSPSGPGPSPSIDWAVAVRSLAGESISGDLHVVAPFPEGVLLGVVDGVGHGREAATVARRTADTLKDFAAEPLEAVVRRCHEALRGTRGAVMSLAAVHTTTATMTWLGVGNVEGVLLAGEGRGSSGHTGLVSRGGVVGGDLPPLRPATIPVAAGDLLCFATDGVDPAFASTLHRGLPVQGIADAVLKQYGRRSDDALILVARILDVAAR